MEWLWVSPLFQHFYIFFSVTAKLLGLKNVPITSHQNVTKELRMMFLFIFGKLEQLQRRSAYMNKQHLNIKFSIEATTNGILPFLDTKMYKEIGKFVTSVYREDTFSGVYTNCTSLIPLEYKFSLLYTLFHRCFCLVYGISNFHFELEKHKNNFFKNCSRT